MKSNPGIDYWRGKIDKLNQEILRLLQVRVVAARRIGAIKKKKGLPISDPKREKAIIAHLVKQRRDPLDAKAVRDIFKTIIRETKRIEHGA